MDQRMFKSKHICEEDNNHHSSSFEDDTFRHLLSEKRTILVNNLIVDNMIERIVVPIIAINEMDDEVEAESKTFVRDNNPIRIMINTNGGTATEVFSCISAIELSRTPVYTYAMGKAFSGGFYLLLAGHRRFCQKYSTLMYHQIQTGLPHGDMKTSMEHIDETVRMQELFNNFILRRSKIKSKVLLEANSKKLDWYMGAVDALKNGVVDSLYY